MEYIWVSLNYLIKLYQNRGSAKIYSCSLLALTIFYPLPEYHEPITIFSLRLYLGIQILD